MKLLHRAVVLAVCFCFLLALTQGCTYKHGDEGIRHLTGEELKDKLVKGVTTQEDVRVMFGEPSQTGYSSDGKELWTYKYGEAKQSGVAYVPFLGLFAPPPESKGKSLTIIFTTEKVVDSYSFGGAVGQHGSWE